MFDEKSGQIYPFPVQSDPHEKASHQELVQMLRQDDELCDFFRFVKENGLRERAVELVSRRLAEDNN